MIKYAAQQATHDLTIIFHDLFERRFFETHVGRYDHTVGGGLVLSGGTGGTGAAPCCCLREDAKD